MVPTPTSVASILLFLGTTIRAIEKKRFSFFKCEALAQKRFKNC